MAEVVGFAASIAGLLSLTIQVVQINQAYVDSIRDAPEVIESYLKQVTSLKDELSSLNAILNEPDVQKIFARRVLEERILAEREGRSPNYLEERLKAIKDCRQELENILATLEKRMSRAHSLRVRLTWHFREEHLRTSLEKLHKRRTIIVGDLSNTIAVHGTVSLEKKLPIIQQHLNALQKAGDATAQELKRLNDQLLEASRQLNGEFCSGFFK